MGSGKDNEDLLNFIINHIWRVFFLKLIETRMLLKQDVKKSSWKHALRRESNKSGAALSLSLSLSSSSTNLLPFLETPSSGNRQCLFATASCGFWEQKLGFFSFLGIFFFLKSICSGDRDSRFICLMYAVCLGFFTSKSHPFFVVRKLREPETVV